MDNDQRTASQVATSAATAFATSSLCGEHARFLPGTIVGERYRVIAQVGRGGMGEIYRADDLRLGQPVALKFLPESLTRDDAALARLMREVRTARQVSHPNVCRVFDIGEANGVPFITMEFVDGEDLASLLQRIGRLQPAKALQLAHQLCAGLAEIHAFGILHRDLKPANVMLDGRGNLRITDFGLAVIAHDIPGEETSAGTPAYMAPEQLAGEKPSQQSDIYALGLILFELFTGKPAFENRRTRTSSTIKPSAIARELDGVIERAILRCLEREPGARPRTASVVASALPGGDPLAAAIAAGETPSPDMVAAALDEPAIGRAKAWMLLAVIVVALAAILGLQRFANLVGLAPPDKSPDALIENAQQIAGRLGYTAPAADVAFFAATDQSQIRYLADHEDSRTWRRTLRDAFPAVHQFWWRQSPRPMRTMAGWISEENPAATVPGMLTIRIDQRGRLLRFAAVPPEFEPAPPTPKEPDWAVLFDAAGLPLTSFAPALPKWQPPMAFDRQAAWEGTYGTHLLQVSAASFHGRIVFFRVTGPWDQPIGTTRPTLSERIAEYTTTAVTFGLWIAGLFLARRNWLLGRGDRRGAFKFGFAIAFLLSFAFYGTMHHGSGFFEMDLFVVGIGASLSLGLLAAALYLAIEPLVRRRWPNYLVGWTRLLAGRFGDARVGRDLLVGVAAATVLRVFSLAARSLPNWVIIPGLKPATVNLAMSSLLEFANLFGVVFVDAVLYWSLGVLAMVLFASSIFRSDRIAFAIVFLVLFLSLQNGEPWPYLPLIMVTAAVTLFLLARFGFLAMSVWFLTAFLLANFPLTADPARWYFARSCFMLAIPLAISIHGFRAALAGRPPFGRDVAGE